MGGIGFEIPLVRRGEDGPALVRALWDRIAKHVVGKLVGNETSRDFIRTYASLEASDGIAEGGWHASDTGVHFSFGDAAGLCYLEMEATQHWAILATLDLWDELDGIAKEHGAELGEPSKLFLFPEPHQVGMGARDLLRDIVSTKRRSVLFPLGKRVASSTQRDAPEDDDQIILQAKIRELGSFKGAERKRICEIIVAGRCLCEACQKVRATEGLPLVGETATPKKTKKKSAAAAPPVGGPLETAPIVSLRDPEALLASGAIALDLGLPWDAKGNVDPAIFGVLPSLPLRALSLVNHQLRQLPPDVTSCTGLEVLSLAGTRRVRIGKALADLEALRAIEIDYNPRGTKTADFALLCQIPSLEVVDDVIWSGAIPPELATLTRLRSITVSPRGRCRMLEPLPLEAVTTFEAVPEVIEKPLRFYDGPVEGMPRDTSRLELLATDGLPDTAPDLASLRGLVLKTTSMPRWVADLPHLSVLRVLEVGDGPTDFAVLGALEKLRYLVVSAKALAQTNDFSRLAALETLVIYGKIASEEHVPRGLRDLPRLRTVHYRVAAHERGVEPASLAPRLPEGCLMTTEVDALDHSPWWSPLIWFRALCTDPGDPAWWLSRFDRGEAFETLAKLVR